jgi:hypothetical protein
MRFAQRNNVDIPEDQFPAGVVFDGDEDTNTDLTSKKPGMSSVMRMSPEILIAEKSQEAGSDLATLRRALIKSVLLDAGLAQIVNTQGNGVIRYIGCNSDHGWMRSNQGALIAHFIFAYALIPDQL